uniref:Uncharacterized protein n=1 Tax=Anguilla anguilla TaxID=7936 RepID=A0A0E9QW78_ANGAN
MTHLLYDYAKLVVDCGANILFLKEQI